MTTDPFDLVDTVQNLSTIHRQTDFLYRERTKHTGAWTGIIVHWTGGSGGTDSAVDYTGRDGSGGWYHYICGREKTVQCIDPDTHRAGHAGSKWNSRYIGVASSQPIAPGFRVGGTKTRADYDAAVETILERARDRKYETEVIENGAWARTYPTVLRMDPVHARQIAALCAAMCERHGIPRRVHAGMKPSCLAADGFAGVCFHHQVSTNGKWDCLPWMPELIEAFESRNFEVVGR